MEPSLPKAVSSISEDKTNDMTILILGVACNCRSCCPYRACVIMIVVENVENVEVASVMLIFFTSFVLMSSTNASDMRMANCMAEVTDDKAMPVIIICTSS